MGKAGSGVNRLFRVIRIERRGYYKDVMAACEEEAIEMIDNDSTEDGILCFAEDGEVVDVFEVGGDS